MNFNADRRGALLSFCAGLMVSGLAQSGPVNAAAEPTLVDVVTDPYALFLPVYITVKRIRVLETGAGKTVLNA